jgi:hypothetical protein
MIVALRKRFASYGSFASKRSLEQASKRAHARNGDPERSDLFGRLRPLRNPAGNYSAGNPV